MLNDGQAVEVLGTLTYVAPKLDEFQFVKFRSEGEVAYLTLDRPEHNLLNERMLAELCDRNQFAWRAQRDQADRPGFGGESVLRRH